MIPFLLPGANLRSHNAYGKDDKICSIRADVLGFAPSSGWFSRQKKYLPQEMNAARRVSGRGCKVHALLQRRVETPSASPLSVISFPAYGQYSLGLVNV